jgi:glutamine amidotransferase
MSYIKICILDYGSGNVGSISNLLKYLKYDSVISNNIEEIKNASHVILPGVGSFGSSMSKINEKIPINILKHEIVQKGKPFLGICVGMQVLTESGFENGNYKGLGWIKGTVRKLEAKNLPLPHIGWNSIRVSVNNLLTKNLEDIDDFYFVHSYHCEIDNKYIISNTTYGQTFCSMLNYNNIFGVQFHPEKSQKAGLKIIKNFINIT